MSKITTILFDMDGVLTDSMSYHIKYWMEAFEKFGVNITEQDMRDVSGTPANELIDILCDKYNKELTNEEKYSLLRYKLDNFNNFNEIAIFPNVDSNLKKLKDSGFNIGLVTGSQKESALEVVNSHFKNIFDVIVTATDTFRGKPYPDPYLKAIEDLGVKNKESIVVEDAVGGINSAIGAHIKVIAIATTNQKEVLKDANYIVENHEELFELLNSFN